MSFKDRLKEARKAAQLTQQQLADALGLTQSTIDQWESGLTMPRPQRNKAIAKILKVDVIWLLEGVNARSQNAVPLVGLVGMGAQIHPVASSLSGEAPDSVPAPPGEDIEGVVAVQVQGDDMAPAYFDGNIIYYVPRSGNPDDAIGSEIIACLEDGRILVKRLAAGRIPGCYDLIGYNGAVMQDQRLQWVAEILWVRKKASPDIRS